MSSLTRRNTSLPATLLLLAVFAAGLAFAAEYGTSFTYQGSLKAGGSVVNGPADLQFEIYNVEAGGIPLTAPIVLNATPVVDGVFTVELDFGTLPQAADEHWLEIVVNSTILAPRQRLSPAPLSQATLRVPLVFGGQIQESPFWDTSGDGAFALPNGITPAVYAESRAQLIMPASCTAKNLFVRNLSTSNYPSTTVTLNIEGVATPLSCAQISGNGPSCSNTVDSFDVEAGDLVSIHFTPNLPARPISNDEAEIRAFVSFSWMCE